LNDGHRGLKNDTENFEEDRMQAELDIHDEPPATISPRRSNARTGTNPPQPPMDEAHGWREVTVQSGVAWKRVDGRWSNTKPGKTVERISARESDVPLSDEQARPERASTADRIQVAPKVPPARASVEACGAWERQTSSTKGYAKKPKPGIRTSDLESAVPVATSRTQTEAPREDSHERRSRLFEIMASTMTGERRSSGSTYAGRTERRYQC
jgi:hypothetical protein